MEVMMKLFDKLNGTSKAFALTGALLAAPFAGAADDPCNARDIVKPTDIKKLEDPAIVASSDCPMVLVGAGMNTTLVNHYIQSIKRTSTDNFGVYMIKGDTGMVFSGAENVRDFTDNSLVEMAHTVINPPSV